MTVSFSALLPDNGNIRADDFTTKEIATNNATAWTADTIYWWSCKSWSEATITPPLFPKKKERKKIN